MSSFSWPPEGAGGGVTSLNTLTGDLTIAAGTGITVTPSGGNTLTIATTALLAAITSINSDTTSAQTLTVGTGGTDFAITNPGGGSHVFNLPTASSSNRGALSSADWTTFNGKQSALTFGNLTESGSANLTVTGGTGAVIGSGVVLTLTGATLLESTSSVLTITGGTNAVLGTGVSIQVKQATTSQSGYLSSTDWNTFNGKQAGPLTGDVTSTGSVTQYSGIVPITKGGTGQTAKTAAFDALQPMTTGGDLIYGGASGTATRLPNGSAGQVLQSNGTTLAPSWAPAVVASPLTTKGDLYGFSTVNARIPVGTDGAYLVADSTQTLGVKWASSGTSSFNAANGSDWVQYTPTFTGFGTPTGVSIWSRRVLDSLEIEGFFVSGTSTATQAQMTLGYNGTNANVTADSTKVPTTMYAGPVTFGSNTAQIPNTLMLGGNGYIQFGIQASGSNGGTPLTGSAFIGTGVGIYIRATVPISGWTSNSTVTVIGTAAVAPTIQKFTSGSGTYTLPSSPRTPLYLRVRMIGAGGGGGGSGTGSFGTGGSGTTTTFGTTLLSAGGGSGGAQATTGGAPGTSSLGTGPIGTALPGGYGAGGPYTNTLAEITVGGHGGTGPLGGAGSGGEGANGIPGGTNTGGGGGGGGTGATTAAQTGCGGGSGGFIDALISGPSSSYAYSVGTAGTAGTAGTSGFAGGAGGSGYIEVTEYYQ